MKNFIKLLIFFLALLGLVVGIQLLNLGRFIVDDPSSWDGGRGFDAVVHHMIILFLGGGLLVLVSVLGLFGAFFGASRRKGAWWLLVAPGFLGTLVAVAAIVSLVLWQPDWEKHTLMIGLALGVIPFLFWLFGRYFRRQNQ